MVRIVEVCAVLPITGAVVSLYKGLEAGGKGISHTVQYSFKCASDYFKKAEPDYRRIRQKHYHRHQIKECSKLFCLHALNVVTLGFLGTALFINKIVQKLFRHT